MQQAHVIDLSRSYIPVDPESFYENMGFTGQEDAPERLLQIVPFEGYNFLPTMYGYKSYFDTTSKLNITAFSEKVQYLLLFQTSSLKSHLIALAETGAYFTDPQTASSAWTRLYTAGTSTDLWSFCVIENNLYLYRQGAASIAKVPYTGTIASPGLTSITPSFLTMAGQMGIFRANGRLGMWDSANSISWSSLFDFTDFTPSISTLAANVIFNDILGKIITVRSFGDGFIIYSTKNIVGAEFDTGGSILFRARNLAESAGIWDPRQVCSGSTDIEHYVYTNSGIKRVSGNLQVENIFPSVFDFLKESRDPVFLNLINGRYLFLSTPDPSFIYGKVTYNLQTVSSYTIRFLQNGASVSTTLPTTVNGKNLLDDIFDDITYQKSDEGLYTQWTATGSVMVSSRIPSSMNPFELDDPSTVDDDHPYVGNTTPLMSMNDLIAIRDSVNPTFVSPHSLDDSPVFKQLGWTNGSQGLTDTALTRFKNRQNLEWYEYTNLANNLSIMINGISPSSTTILYGSTLYASFSNVVAATPADITGTYTKIGEFPVSGPDPVETFTGVGSYNAGWEYTKTFNAGKEVQHSNNARTYTRQYYLAGRFLDGLKISPSGIGLYTPSFPGHTNPIGTNRYEPWIDTSHTRDANIPYRVTDPYLPIFHTDEAILLPLVKTYFENNYYNTIFTFPPTLDFARVDGSRLFSDCPFLRAEVSTPYSDTVIYAGIYQVDNEEIVGWYMFALLVIGYGIHETSYKSLRTVDTAISPAVVSTATADQDCLDWCNYLTYNPNTRFPYATGAQTIPLTVPPSVSTLPPYASYTYPGATFLLQNGSAGPAYPTMVGSLVYDTHLQKWGKQKNSFYTLLDYTPVNSTVEKTVSFTNVGMDAGIITTDGKVKLFGTNCATSFIRYGKFGFNRQGFSNIEEICLNFKEPFTGSIDVECSIDGRNLQASLLQSESFSGEGYCRVYPSYAGRWYTVSIKGIFDIRSMYVTGNNAGWR